MAFHLGLQPKSHATLLFVTTAPMLPRKRSGFRRLCIRNCVAMDPKETRKLVLEVKEKLSQYDNLPVGKNGRVDDEMILWFLKDRKFSVEDAVSKLTKAIRWRHEFGVSNLSEESVKSTAETGKAYLHDNFDVYGRPVLIVEASKHFPQDPYEDEKLCVFLIEKAISRFPAGTENILAIIDLRGFGTRNADIKFLTFLFDVFYYYYPRRLGEVLFVEAPFIFQPVWQLAKPMLKSYASLVRFCSVAEVRKEYFTEETIPASFRR
ncbi:phosphatidylinositol transfer protein CSR1 isoform X1 [Ipomoea triloba]|uniref:phosphatidylinositol transfer protein CSR1 isoform X1 n=1 Tax=Ipomoea triloba TaxID=35885 RepID=UPI00125E1092|nr:phosphatidylinositol transfer protein CSR1 isoform X1 [Ipomoea triloba]XP_031105331.1 phosphatidylinositol transfer protein CSR1 isoform X1 [Ipomoea triloba]